MIKENIIKTEQNATREDFNWFIINLNSRKKMEVIENIKIFIIEQGYNPEEDFGYLFVWSGQRNANEDSYRNYLFIGMNSEINQDYFFRNVRGFRLISKSDYTEVLKNKKSKDESSVITSNEKFIVGQRVKIITGNFKDNVGIIKSIRTGMAEINILMFGSNTTIYTMIPIIDLQQI